jgi:hypothetical protein
MANLNQNYKAWHRPNTSGTTASGGTSRTYQGLYNIINKEKYIGNPQQCIYRSGWEFSFCKFCDSSPSVTLWSSEPTRIPYRDPTSKLDECKRYNLNPQDPRNWLERGYHVDFWMQIKKPDGTIEKMFIEIKPKKSLIKPIPPLEGAPLKVQKRFVIEAKEYLVNEAKWAAMNAYCKKIGASFYVFTEDTLQKIIGNFFLEKPPSNK